MLNPVRNQALQIVYTMLRVKQPTDNNNRPRFLIHRGIGLRVLQLFEHEAQGIDFFFLAFAVNAIKAAREMNDVVFSSSCLQP